MGVTERVTLKDWLRQSHTTKEYQSLFMVMDMTMHYIHNQGYGVLPKRGRDGYPELDTSRILVVTGENPQVIFSDIDTIEPSYQKQLVRDNIYSNAYTAIKAYSNFDQELNHKFLKENFREFELFLPEEDVPYYRGIIERDASVYYAEYTQKRIEKQVEKEGGSLQGLGNSLSKSTDIGKAIASQYGQLDSNNTAAFVHLYIFPAVILALSLLIPLIAWVFALLER